MMANFKRRTHSFSICNNRARHLIWSKASVPFGSFYETFVTSILLHSIHNGWPPLVVCPIMLIQYCHVILMRSCCCVTKRNQFWSRSLKIHFTITPIHCPLLASYVYLHWLSHNSQHALFHSSRHWAHACDMLPYIEVDSDWECLLVGLATAVLYMWQLR